MKIEDTRRYPRVDIALLVQYRFVGDEQLHTDYAINVSASGIFIELTDSVGTSTDITSSEASKAHVVGTEVHVQLTMKDGGPVMRGGGRVVRTVAGGAAIELSDFDAEATATIDAMVRAVLERRPK